MAEAEGKEDNYDGRGDRMRSGGLWCKIGVEEAALDVVKDVAWLGDVYFWGLHEW